ncbi:MAG TPA: transporter substrate-binding domain-containing protein [Gammaproteobacteria bacterium]|nr:transporter substrate-binding domain-containing protein [Gammaproteobacteria bacterium]
MRSAGLAILIILVINFTSTVQARETLVIAIAEDPPYHNAQGTGFVNVLEREVMNRVGYDVRFDKLPSERALLYANEGISDGVADRVIGIDKYYPNLIRVNEPVMTWNFVAFSRRTDIRINGWQSIKPYSLGIVNGWKILERNTEDALFRTKVRNIDLLFTLLKNGRADLVLTEVWQGLFYLKKHPINNVKLLYPILVSKVQFMYLHKKHRKLAPKIAEALRGMKKDGSYQKIVDKILTPLK